MRPSLTLHILALFLLGFSAPSFSQYAPILIDIPPSIDLECGQQLPPPSTLDAVPYEPCGDVSMAISEYRLCPDYEIYTLKNPTDIDWGIHIAHQNGSPRLLSWTAESRLFVNSEQGFIVGEIYDPEEPLFRYSMFLRMELGRSWEEWTGLLTTDGTMERQVRLFGGPPPGVGPEPWRAWQYYEVDGETSQLSGMDDLLGSSSILEHAPVNRLFAVQVGVAASGYSAGHGVCAWSIGDAVVQGTSTMGQYSIYGDIDLLGTVGELYCDDVVIRNWTATNECGLRTTATQLVTASGGSFPADIDGDGSVDVEDFVMLNSAYGGTCADCPEDINDDGVVDVLDLLEWNSAFGAPCD